MVSPLDSVAQLGEHLSYKQKVIGSNPVRVITNYSLSAQIIVSGTCFGFFESFRFSFKEQKVHKRQKLYETNDTRSFTNFGLF